MDFFPKGIWNGMLGRLSRRACWIKRVCALALRLAFCSSPDPRARQCAYAKRVRVWGPCLYECYAAALQLPFRSSPHPRPLSTNFPCGKVAERGAMARDFRRKSVVLAPLSNVESAMERSEGADSTMERGPGVRRIGKAVTNTD